MAAYSALVEVKASNLSNRHAILKPSNPKLILKSVNPTNPGLSFYGVKNSQLRSIAIF